MRILEGLKPERVMYYFEELTKIPRCSFDEERISEYLLNMGKSMGLESIQDESLNVIIKKPATMDTDRTIILQGHMDMVGEKTDESNHDFKKDPIKMEIENGRIIAKETTLGGDNGIAVAMALAILESDEIQHPNLEVLFTSTEEAGMDGAEGLSTEHFKADTLINIDSEEEGVFFVSCAGGERNTVELSLERVENDFDMDYKISVTGLLGGHSGMEIDQERGNSNKLMGRLLFEISKEMEFGLINLEGGSKANAIPRFTTATISINEEEKLLNIIKAFEDKVKIELNGKDSNVQVESEKNKLENRKYIEKVVAGNIVKALNIIPNGVQSMSKNIEGLVESSNNMGVVTTFDDRLTIECAIRSSVGSLKDDISNRIGIIADLIGGKSIVTSKYPAWEYRENSYIRDLFMETYREVYGKDAEIAAIHAGLECGLFDEKFDDLDMVSFGPNLYGVHAPGESMDIESVERVYNLLLEVLKKIK